MAATTDNFGPGPTRGAACPVVAIGASAGGLEALRQLFSKLPDDTGMAVIVIQHLDPSRPSLLTSVLAGDVHMPVVEVTDGMRAEPNRVHVIPPGADLGIDRGVLTLLPRCQTGKLHLPIDSFFRALAEDNPGGTIGVVLSGSGSDGTEGLRAIKAAGGITFVQHPKSAQFRSMPESAIAAGVADFCLPPDEIAGELARLCVHPYLVRSAAVEIPSDEIGADEEGSLASVLTSLCQNAHLDFRGYKRPTLMRRIAKRMALRRQGSLSAYASSIRDDAEECEALAQDILIHVTAFFRDRAAFQALERHVLPELLKNKDADTPIRVWVPGCSTGKEAYSIAMALLDSLRAEGRDVPIKIFGSDLSERAIESARAGLYAESELDGVSPERVARFFDRAEGSYRVNKRVRDLCVFVRHDLTRDPPFAKLDLISCRNVLIYFDTDLQRRIVPLLHHSLNAKGYLFLGSSEGIGGFGEIFAAVDKEHRIFLKVGESPRVEYPLALGREAESRLPGLLPTQRPRPAREAQKQADHVLLSRYAPPGVVVNDRLDVVQFRGRTGDFIEPPPGQPQTNLLKMTREGLVTHLRDALERAKTQSATIRKEGIRLASGVDARVVNLEVVPLVRAAGATERYFLVVFEEADVRCSVPVSPPGEHSAAQLTPDAETTRLEADLAATRDYLQVVVAEHQDATEELAAANEEMVATNEELQSTNEELQSAKEELQSTNEELTTLNDELRSSNRQLDVVASDLINVLESVQIPVIIVDHALRIRRFTPSANEVASLLPGDIGRSIDDVKVRLKLDDLSARISGAVETNTAKEWEIQRTDGRWFRLHVDPYRTADGRLDGAILSFVDVDVLKHALETAERARDFAQGIVETVPISLVVLDRDLRVVSANTPFYQGFAATPELAGRSGFFELAAGAWHGPALRDAIERCFAERSPFRGLEARCTYPTTGSRDLLVTGSPLQGASGEWMILLALEDVTERRLLELSENRARTDAEQANRAKDLFLATLSHELRTPLNAILLSAQLLQKASGENPKLQRASAVIERAVWNQVRLVDDLLDISRINSGKLMLDFRSVDPATVVQGAFDMVRTSADAKELTLGLSMSDSIRPVRGDPVRLQQVVANLLNNAIKFTPKGGTVSVSLEADHDQARITVSDTGAGLSAEMLAQIFTPFVQAEGAMTRAHGGLGLGLAIVRHLVEAHGGEVHADSSGEGRGSTFTVTLPLAAHVEAAPLVVSGAARRDITGIRVLLVEDDDDTREACASMIQELGAEVRVARTSAEGLRVLESFTPQVILCDVAMPGEDGYAFIRRLRAGKQGERIPAAALTALASEEDRRRVLEAGFQMHAAKPIDSGRLATIIGALSSRLPRGG